MSGQNNQDQGAGTSGPLVEVPKASFFNALILAPILGSLPFAMLEPAVTVVAIIIGGPCWLIFATPIIWKVLRLGMRLWWIVPATFLGNLICTPSIVFVTKFLIDGHMRNLDFAIQFVWLSGMVVTPIWAGVFCLLYLWYQDTSGTQTNQSPDQ
jgi:hypothetical protein